VIYESALPQIMILWRIPGTTIYRNIKQESCGAFVPHVFIARIGSSMYFANASFIKDMLLGYVADLQEVNSTEYLVLEMSSVVSVDSTAVHVLMDVVTDFRSRGVQIAFAMVGNRLERTFKKADLFGFVGERWFFPTVHDAVVGCLRHQQSKRSRMRSNSNISFAAELQGVSEATVAAESEGIDLEAAGACDDADDAFDVQENPVHPGNEIGLSNDIHHSCTVIFINMAQDVPMIMSEITAIFQNRLLTVCRANIEAMGDSDDDLDQHVVLRRANHVYHVRSLESGGKLQEQEQRLVKADLQGLLDRYLGGRAEL